MLLVPDRGLHNASQNVMPAILRLFLSSTKLTAEHLLSRYFFHFSLPEAILAYTRGLEGTDDQATIYAPRASEKKLNSSTKLGKIWHQYSHYKRWHAKSRYKRLNLHITYHE